MNPSPIQDILLFRSFQVTLAWILIRKRTPYTKRKGTKVPMPKVIPLWHKHYWHSVPKISTDFKVVVFIMILNLRTWFCCCKFCKIPRFYNYQQFQRLKKYYDNNFKTCLRNLSCKIMEMSTLRAKLWSNTDTEVDYSPGADLAFS